MRNWLENLVWGIFYKKMILINKNKFGVKKWNVMKN